MIPDTADVDESTWPSIIVTRKVPIYLVGVWANAEHTIPVPALIVPANQLYDGWPNVNVINLGEIPAGTERLYVEYYHPGSKYIITQKYPLSMPYTVYEFPITRDDQDILRINDAILRLNPYKTDPNDADPVNPNLPGVKSGLLGVFDNPKLTGVNYFKYGADNYSPPTPNSDHRDHGIIRLSNVPANGWSKSGVKTCM